MKKQNQTVDATSNIKIGKEMTLESHPEYRSLFEHVANEYKRISEDINSERSRHAVAERLEKDPRQMAKKFINLCWLTWQEEPERYKYKSDFAKDMLRQQQCASLKSQKKIEDWCREWESSTQPEE